MPTWIALIVVIAGAVALAASSYRLSTLRADLAEARAQAQEYRSALEQQTARIHVVAEQSTQRRKLADQRAKESLAREAARMEPRGEITPEEATRWIRTAVAGL